MVIEIDKASNVAEIRRSLQQMRENRIKARKSNFSDFFGALPNIGDGLAFQKSVRDEWN